MTILILIVLGLCMGSFVDALTWRIRQQAVARKPKTKKSKAQKTASNKELSILHGRSMCPNCKHQLSAADLIPVFSWLSLRGKCRYCKKPISWQIPLVEVLTSSLFVASYLWWPAVFDSAGKADFAVWLVMLTGFMALLVYDLRWLILPNRIVFPLIYVALAWLLINFAIFDGTLDYARDIVLSVIISSGIFYGLFTYSKGKWIGGGDVKLGILIGLLIADPWASFLVIFLASLIGTVVILPGLVSKKLTTATHIPFGPFLIIATIIVKLFGTTLIQWYKSRFLIV